MMNVSLQMGVCRTQLGPPKATSTDESGAISSILAISRTACMAPDDHIITCITGTSEP